ncbi:MAG TPA: hypothetical protein VHX68_18525, partial [Planctomycetaceae bacterium]|nr:hypothetical protein [Planctomycetaceae bacterium]
MKSDIFSWLRPLLAAAVLATPLTVRAAPSSVGPDTKLDKFSVGIGGVFKVGRWTDLTVNLGSQSPPQATLEVDAPDPEGSIVTFHSEPVQLPQNGPHVVSVLFKMGRLAGNLNVRVLSEGRVVLNRQVRVSADPDADVAPPLRQTVFLIGHVRGSSPSTTAAADHLASILSSESSSTTEGSAAFAARPAIQVIDIDSFESLPAQSSTFASLDAILFDGRAELNSAQSDAIKDWVRLGGHLIVTLGKSGPSFAKCPLAAWIPIKVQGMLRLNDLSAIESFCRQSSRIMSPNDEPVDAARLSEGNGKSLISSLEGSLLCRSVYGLGRITVFGIDPDNPELARWGGIGDLWRRLFDLEEPQLKRAQPMTARLTQTGISELATQLDATQDDFPSVARVTTWPVMGLMVALLLVIGPIDYLLVHKLLNRPELTWITFPLFVVAAAGSFVWWGTWTKGNKVLSNQLDIVDVDTDSGLMRARSCNLVYSPENRRYNLAAEAESIGSQGDGLRMAWHGRAESSFGGMYRGGGAEIARPPYSVEPADRGLDGVPIAVWSAKNLETEWEGHTTNLVDNQLESPGPSRLAGNLRHHLPEPIEDWVVAYGHQIFRPRTDAKTGRTLALAPDVPWSPLTASQRELTGYLTGARRVEFKSET